MNILPAHQKKCSNKWKLSKKLDQVQILIRLERYTRVANGTFLLIKHRVTRVFLARCQQGAWCDRSMMLKHTKHKVIHSTIVDWRSWCNKKSVYRWLGVTKKDVCWSEIRTGWILSPLWTSSVRFKLWASFLTLCSISKLKGVSWKVRGRYATRTSAF